MTNQLLRIILMSGKISIYLLVVKSFLFAIISASDLNAQFKSVHDVYIEMDIEKASVKTILNQIEKKTDYSFQYYKNDIPQNIQLSLQADEISVAEVLYDISSKTNLKFRQVNNSIAVAKKKKKADTPVEIVVEVTINGKVTDQEGEGVPGVTVLVKGTTNGTITDIDGSYTLKVPDDAIIVFSYIGFKTQEIALEGRTVLDVTLEQDLQELQEVVVVGFGEMDRRRMTESISVVDAEILENAPFASFDNVLQGVAPGVQVAATGGQPGGAVSVRVRGIGSITSGSAPLYVVDGVPINGGNLTDEAQTGNGLANINPNDIESISILKDASATSIYGSRGANGVVLITTKRGKPGKGKVKLSVQRGYSDFENPNDFQVMDAQEYLAYHREAVINAGGNPDLPVLENGNPNPVYFPLGDTINTNWVDEALQDGTIAQYDLSASGGTDKTSYFTSIGYYSETGIVTETNFERITARVNVNQNITDRAKVGVNLTISDANQTNRQGGGTSFRDPIYGAFYLSPLYPVYANAEQIAAGEDYGTGFNFNTPGFAGHNIVASQQLNTNEVQTFRTIGNIYASYEIIPNLTARTSFGLDRVDLQEDEFLSPRYEAGRTGGAETDGLAIVNKVTEIDWTFTNTISYFKEIGNDHAFDVLLGQELFESTSSNVTAQGQGFATDKLPKVGSAAEPGPDGIDTDDTSWRLSSFFAKATYSYQEKYLVNLSARRDGSSRFGPETRWANFGAIGVGYILSEEAFMESAGFVNFLKFKASYGTQGNVNLGSNFPWLTSYRFSDNYNPYGQAYSGSSPSNLGDRSITWESQRTFDVGIETRIFERVDLEIGYYDRQVTDMIFDVPVSRTTGFNDIQTNAGELRNRGWEVQLGAQVLRVDDFTWSTNIQFSTNDNEIVDLPNVEEFINTGDQEINREGESINMWYMPEWAGVDPANGKPLWYDEAGNVTSDYSQADFRIVGQQLPDYFGTFANTFSYKGLSLSASFYFNQGNDIYREVQRFLSADGARFGRNQDRNQLARWQKPGDITDVPRISQGNADGGNNHSSRYLEDGSFVKLRTVTLAYNLPSEITSKLKMANVRFYVQGFNLKTWTNFRGLDPEVGLGSRDFGEYPNPRKLLFGIDIEL